MADEKTPLDDKAYEVGYGKPPRETQFRKGKSGNPKGRPKGTKSLERLLLKVSGEPVKVISNGKTRHISKLEAALLQLTNKAVGGDLKAIREFLAVHRALVKPEQPTEKSPNTKPDDKDAPLVILTSVPRPFRKRPEESPRELPEQRQRRGEFVTPPVNANVAIVRKE
jgi:hypothetical protein